MQDVVVVGAGVFGIWTAFSLRAAGVRVTLVDAYGPGNSRSSSSDESRILRCGYGPDEIYSRMARRSREAWRALDAGRLWHPCGVLWLAADADPYTEATRRALESSGFPLVALDHAALGARYPQLSCDGIQVALLEPEGGVLLARRAVQHLAGELVTNGVVILLAQASPLPPVNHLDAVELTGGRRLAADAFVFACGAWMPRVLGPVIGSRIRPTRQVVVYFGPPPGELRFGPSEMPAWIDFPAGIYGVPDIDGRGVKVGIDEHGPPFDPDTSDRTPDRASIDRARAWLARRAPVLADAPVVETRVCQYENTSTGDFVIDRHPTCRNVWIVGGGSGHGFKHGPAVGELAARLVLTGAAVDEPRFAYASKTVEPRRSVY